MNPLQSVPTNVRAVLYWVGYVVGVVSQMTTILWGAIAAASPDVEMPLGLVIASAVMGFLQTQLNLLAGSNVTNPREEDLVNPIVNRDERGVYDTQQSLILALAVVGIVLIVLLVAGVL